MSISPEQIFSLVFKRKKIKIAFETYEHNTANDPSNPDHQLKAAEASVNYTRLTGKPIEQALIEAHAKFHKKNEKYKNRRKR